jgi:hypothetical protein
VLPRHGEDEVGSFEVLGAYLAAAMRGYVEPVAHHRGHRLGARRLAVAEHAAGTHGRGRSQRGKAIREQGLGHWRPADVRRTDNEHF